MEAMSGLNEKEIFELRKKFGYNALPDKEGLSKVLILLSQFKSPLIYIVFLAALASIAFGEYNDAILIGLVIILNVLMGFFQEHRAQKTLKALRRIIKPKTLVIRNGERKEIETRYLVPGDLVVLGIGNRIPADGKVLESMNLLVREAILTGEEEAVVKSTEEGSNSVFMGTIVASGRGIMIIEKIGMETEIGKIGKTISEIKEEKTPLQEKLEGFAKTLVWIIIIVCFCIFLLGVFENENIWKNIKMAVVLSIAAIPEGLPIAVTMILALGMRKILKKKGLVKKLLAIETLGAVSVICTDKTGTITEGIMRVVKSDFSDNQKASLVLSLANEQRSNLELALFEYAKKIGAIDQKKLIDSQTRIYEEQFTSERKYMMSVNRIDGKETAFLIGAPDIIISFCDVQNKEQILEKIEKWASEGLKILGAAYKETGNLKEKNGFSWLGLVGVEDPIREGVKEAISVAKEAGIEVKIVTGDFHKTAEKIALNLGFNIGPENVMEGKELEIISDEEFKNKIDKISLFSRVTPHQKLRIVKILQEKGEIVSMTGDGVNDALALKKADMGVVMGDASDVAKEVGDLILLDNNFKTIISACEEGRLIFSNIKKVVAYVLSNSFAEIILIFGAMLFYFPSPLTVAQILWIHLICDGPPDIILGFEPNTKELMKEKPKKMKKESILSREMKFLILAISATIGVISLLFFKTFYDWTNNLDLARTIVFATVTTADLVYIFSFKNLEKPIFKMEGFFKNKYLFLAVLFGFILLFFAIYNPRLNAFLGTVPLPPIYWSLVFSVALLTTFLAEITKILSHRKKQTNI